MSTIKNNFKGKRHCSTPLLHYPIYHNQPNGKNRSTSSSHTEHRRESNAMSSLFINSTPNECIGTDGLCVEYAEFSCLHHPPREP
jgi:hypothetical protein